MAGIAVKLKSEYKDFSNSEKKVADYILLNEEVVPFKTIYEIADRVNVSVPTISRLVKKIGYGSFKDFKIDLAISFFIIITPASRSIKSVEDISVYTCHGLTE